MTRTTIPSRRPAIHRALLKARSTCSGAVAGLRCVVLHVGEPCHGPAVRAPLPGLPRGRGSVSQLSESRERSRAWRPLRPLDGALALASWNVGEATDAERDPFFADCHGSPRDLPKLVVFAATHGPVATDQPGRPKFHDHAAGGYRLGPVQKRNQPTGICVNQSVSWQQSSPWRVLNERGLGTWER